MEPDGVFRREASKEQLRRQFNSRHKPYASWNHSIRTGATSVEFAFVFPVFLLLIIGSMLLFRYSLTANMLEGAIMEGARRGILAGATVPQVETVAKNYLQNSGLTGYTVNAQLASVSGHSEISIQASIPVTRTKFFWGGGTLTIRRSCTMRCE